MGSGGTTRIRRMTLDDLDWVMEMEDICFPEPWTRNHFLAEMKNPEISYSIVAEVHGKRTGYAVAWYIEDEMQIANVAVHPEMRRRGVGCAIMNHVMDEGKRRGGIRYVFLEVRALNTAAINLYKKFGFFGVGSRKNYYRTGDRDAQIMMKIMEDITESIPNKIEVES